MILKMNKEEVKHKLDIGESVPFDDYFFNQPIKIYKYSREEFYFTYDFGNGEERFCSWEWIVSKVD